ncbi:MAG: hypothetical protein WBN40_05035, partial [Pseudomonadales bacterium]
MTTEHNIAAEKLAGSVAEKFSAKVVAINDDVVTIKSVADSVNGRPLKKNEVVYIHPASAQDSRSERLKAEILRVTGDRADAQVFEDTAGVAIGDGVEQTGELLSVELGPGLLRQVFDGLQSPLHRLELMNGRFLLRGAEAPALERNEKWAFSAKARVNDTVHAGDVLGVVQEGRFSHKIMVPFQLGDTYKVDWIQEGSFHVDTIIARLLDSKDRNHEITMVQKWPVRAPIPTRLIKSGRCTKQ